MLDSLILETGKAINGFIRGLSGIGNTFQEQSQPQLQPQQQIQPQPQAIQPKAPCSTCGKMTQSQPQVQPQPQKQPQVQPQPDSHSILFNGGPALVKRPPGSQAMQEPNISGIKFS